MVQCAGFIQNLHHPSFLICELKQSVEFAGYPQLWVMPCDTKSSGMNEEI